MMNIAPFTAEREWTVDQIPVLTASLSVPEPVPPAGKKRIQRYYRLQCRSFIRYCQRWLFPQAELEYRLALNNSTPFSCFRAELNYRVTYQDEGLLSLYTQSREMTLPGHTQLRRWGDTWNLRTGYPLPLSAFLPHPWKRHVITCVSEEIRRQERSGAARYLENWPQKIRRFNPRNYYLTEEGVHIFYPMYAIAPTGIPTFLIPCETTWQTGSEEAQAERQERHPETDAP